MPIGSGIVYNTGDLILSQVSSSGTAFLETKIAAATSSLIYFDSTARINSASLNSITVGTASYVSGSRSIITNLTASNISASGTGSFGIVGIGTVNPAYKLDVNGNANFTNGFYTNTDASSTSYFVGANGTRPIIFQNNTAASYDFGFKFSDSNTFTIVGGNTLANPTTDLVSFTYDGKVGIGTTVPSALLHIYTGSIGSTAYPLLIDNSSGGAGVNVVGFGFANGGIMKHSITTAIYGNDYMAFNVGQGASYNQERMRIDSTGNVGVGTTTVSRKLHAYITTGPVMRLQSSGSNASIEFIPSIGHNRYNWLIGAQQNISDAFEITPSTATNGTTFSNPSILVKSDGNVGIGTTNPTVRLHVSGSSIITNPNPGANSAVLLVQDDGTATTVKDGTTLRVVNNGSAANFSVFEASSGVSDFVILNNGNVGIGTISPKNKLSVIGSDSTLYYNTTAPAAVFQSVSPSTVLVAVDGNVDGYYAELKLGNAQSTYYPYSAYIRGIQGAGIDYYRLEFGTAAGSVASTRMTIANDGNVGIGTTNPVAKLQVSGSISGSSFTSSVSNAVGFLGTASWAQNVVTASYLVPTNSYTITNLTASNISASGTGSFGIVGIGTTSPAYKLDVAGSVYGYNYFTLLTAATYGPSDNSAAMQVFGSTGSGGLTNTIKFVTVGSERWRITDAGILQSPAGQTIQTSTGNLTLATAGGNGHILLSPNGSGNVGIGSSSPSSKFEVLTSAVSLANQPNIIANFRGDTDGRSLIRVDNTSTSAGAAALQAGISFVAYSNVSSQPSANKHEAQIILGSTGATSVSGGQTGTLQIIAPQDIAFNVSASNTIMTGSSYTTFGYNAMYITRAGNIGIGTTNPSSRLHISGSSSTTITITDDALYTNSISNDNSVMTYTVDTGNAAAGSAAHVFKRFNTELVRINPSGNVGIGTTSVNHKLDMWGATGTTFNMANTDDSGRGGKLTFISSSAAGRQFYVGTNSSIYNLVFGIDSIEKMRLDTNGNVGIGVTAPLGRLHITGSATNGEALTLLSKGAGSISQYYISALNQVGQVNYRVTSDINGHLGHDLYYNGTVKVSHNTYWSSWINNDNYTQGGLGIGTNSQTHGYGLTIVKPATSGSLYVSGSSIFTGSVSINGSLNATASWATNALTASFLPIGTYNITSSWANNVISASFATTAQTANALNTGNSYTVSGLTNNGTLSQQGTLSMGSGYQILATTGTTSNPGIAFVGDTNTGIYSSGADTIGLVTGGSEKVTINSTGNVGIGTTSPGAKLDVVGGINSSTANNFNITSGPYNAVFYNNSTSSTDYNAIRIYQGASGSAVGYFGTGGSATGNVSFRNTFVVGTQNSNDFVLNTTDTERVRITSGGNVGIGTTTPNAKLDVNGNIIVTGSLTTTSTIVARNYIMATDTLYIQKGVGGYQSYITAEQTAASTGNSFKFWNSGTGTLMTIGYNGYVGIGTTSPTYQLHVNGGPTEVGGQVVAAFEKQSSTDGKIATFVNTTGSGYTSYIYIGSNPGRDWKIGKNVLNSGTTGHFQITNDLNQLRMQISAADDSITFPSSSVGIGTTNATDKLTVYGAMASYKTGADTVQTQVYLANGGNTRAFNLQLNSGGTGLDLWSYNSANAWLKHTTFDYDGRVGIGTAAPAAKLEISGSSNSALLHVKSPISGAILYVSGSGAVGINTSTVGAYTLQVNGSFAATTKSFVIDHPTKAGKRLIYGSLESPYHGIRLTGRDTLKDGKCKIQLPDYIYKLILHDSVNIQLTGIKCNKTLYVDDINIPENYFTIAYDKALFESYKDYDFFWDFTAIRADVPELNTEL